ncbi:MAG: peptidoglycan DD-metalloendopeptidase family protein [bacterium]|nr:MAG: peptidoglycan DD-metalloendopeptidase family protein [bacterium]
MMMKRLSKICLVMVCACLIQAQDNVDQMQQELEIIQKEITDLQKKLTTQDNQLKIETKSVANIDRQITLTHSKITINKSSISEQENRIASLEKQVDVLEKRIAALQGVFKQQVVFAYKYQRGKQYDWLLGASSFNEVFVKYHYFKKVTQAEKSIFQELSSSKVALTEKENRLNLEVAKTQKLLAAATQEEKNLSERRKTKSLVIKKIRQNRNLLEQSLEEKKQSLEKLKNILASLEKGRPSRQLQVETQLKWEQLSGDFLKNKGKFNWPVQGKLLHGFGRIKNPELKTVLNNTGIDIQAQRGDHVRCVFPGVVSLITYMSGFGNMVIVDHNDGFYTVYAHLDEVRVKSGEFVDGGRPVGLVGESGSLEGPKLHFEIYGNNKNLNPLSWLKKK